MTELRGDTGVHLTVPFLIILVNSVLWSQPGRKWLSGCVRRESLSCQENPLTFIISLKKWLLVTLHLLLDFSSALNTPNNNSPSSLFS